MNSMAIAQIFRYITRHPEGSAVIQKFQANHHVPARRLHPPQQLPQAYGIDPSLIQSPSHFSHRNFSNGIELAPRLVTSADPSVHSRVISTQAGAYQNHMKKLSHMSFQTIAMDLGKGTQSQGHVLISLTLHATIKISSFDHTPESRTQRSLLTTS